MGWDDFITDRKFDVISAIDALDHNDFGFSAINKIVNMLNPLGLFCLHVNCRGEEELNDRHPKQMDLNYLFNITHKMTIIKFEILEKDPIQNNQYKTLVAMWRKK